MIINENTTISININKDQGKYISIISNGDTLEVKSTSKKPKGGAKATLEKIQKILEEIDVDDASKRKLGEEAKEIHQGYSIKNNKKIFYKSHSKEVQSIADRIFHLTTVPEIPVDVFSIMGQFLDVQTLGRLGQVSKTSHAPAQTPWVERAQALGWAGGNDVKEAKAYCQNITVSLDKLGLHAMANQLISNPEAELDVVQLNTIGKKLSYQMGMKKRNSLYKFKPRSNISDFDPLLHFLVHKTANRNFDIDQLPGIRRAFIKVNWNRPTSSNTPLLVTTFLLNINQIPSLEWCLFTDLDQKEAKTLLDLYPHVDLDHMKLYNFCFYTPLYRAIENGNIGWIKALIEKNVNPNATSVSTADGGLETPIQAAVRAKNPEIISLLIKAKADIPQSEAFLFSLIEGSPPSQLVGILEGIMEAGHDLTLLMNTLHHGRTLLQTAILRNHSQEVLEKLVEMGAEINPTERSHSPLLFAQNHKKMQAAVWLTEQGAVVPPKSKN